MKRFSVGRVFFVAFFITVAVVFAAYRYISFSIGEGARAFVRLGFGAIEEAARPLADIEYALHFDAIDKSFSVKSRDASSESSSVKDSNLHDFIQGLTPRPLKLAVIYNANNFPTSASITEFELWTRKVIEPTGAEVLFLNSR